MRGLIFIFSSLLSGILGGAPAILSSENALNVDALPLVWQDLFEAMRSVEQVEARFAEARYFKFKREPQLYSGVFRKAANGSISLAYEGSQAMAVHVGADFAYYRKGEGAVKAIPGFASERSAISLFPALLGMDLVALSETYAVYGEFTGEGTWRLYFKEREDLEESLTYEAIELEGAAASISKIVLRKGAMRSIEIEMEAASFPASFSPEIKAGYFFTL